MSKFKCSLPDMYKLKLFEHMEFRHQEDGYLKGHLYRVPGGWVMTVCDEKSAVFIPYVEESGDIKESGESES